VKEERMLGKEKAIEILICSIILVVLGWLCTQVVGMKETLSSAVTKLDATADRLGRIAEALPYLNVRIAQEEISRPIKVAVVTTKPQQVSSGDWRAAIHVIDPNKAQRHTYSIELDGPKDKKLIYLIGGSVISSDVNAVSFAQLEQWSSISQKELTVPQYVNSNGSFIVNTPVGKYTDVLNSLGMTREAYPVKADLRSWGNLLKELEERKDEYYKVKEK